MLAYLTRYQTRNTTPMTTRSDRAVRPVKRNLKVTLDLSCDLKLLI